MQFRTLARVECAWIYLESIQMYCGSAIVPKCHRNEQKIASLQQLMKLCDSLFVMCLAALRERI